MVVLPRCNSLTRAFWPLANTFWFTPSLSVHDSRSNSQPVCPFELQCEWWLSAAYMWHFDHCLRLPVVPREKLATSHLKLKAPSNKASISHCAVRSLSWLFVCVYFKPKSGKWELKRWCKIWSWSSERGSDLTEKAQGDSKDVLMDSQERNRHFLLQNWWHLKEGKKKLIKI